MKQTGLILLMIFILGFIGLAQEEEFDSRRNPDQPVIKFEKTTLDLGKVEYGGNATCRFEFENTGNKPLILTSVMSSCGSIAPAWPKKPVKPGEKDSLKVIYNTHSEGSFFKSVRVYSNAENSPVFLKIKGQVILNNK
ncbi:MAG: DUF1573 domain-containing protein [Bacteroidales bacterium]|nr:DUF1573 domain-containing protein [Bacteroidales bacterium]